MTKIAPHNTRVFQWFNFFHGFQLFSPIALIYFAAVTDSYAKGASLLSVAFISQVIFEIPTGVISDSGRKRATILGTVSYVLAIALYAIGGNYWFLFMGAVFEGLRGAFFSGNNDSLLYESGLQDGDEKYHRNMAKTETYFHLSATVSAVLGGLIAIGSLRAVYLFSLLPAFAMLAASFAFIEPKKHTVSVRKKSLYHVAEAIRHIARNGKLRIIGLATSLEFGFGHALFGLQLAFINTLWPIWAVGIARAMSGAFATLSYSISGKIIDRFGLLKTVFFSGVWSRLLAFLGLIKPTIASPALLSATSLSFGSSTVAESTLLQQEFNSEQRATLGSITSLAGSFWFAVASISLGYLADKIGLQKALLIGLVPLVISTLLYLRLRQHTR